MSGRSPSLKVAVPTVVQALGTVTAALVAHKATDPAAVALAGSTLMTAILGYLVPHRPIPRPRPRPHPQPHPPAPFVKVFDATQPGQIKAARVVSSSVDALAGYDDGRYANTGEMRRDFPGHHTFSICVFANDDADFGDTEPGNMTPIQLAHWMVDRLHKGRRLIGGYADGSDWRAVDAELLILGGPRYLVPRHQGGPFCRWIAQPSTPPHPHIPAGFDGCQYDWEAGYDASIFYSASLR